MKKRREEWRKSGRLWDGDAPAVLRSGGFRDFYPAKEMDTSTRTDGRREILPCLRFQMFTFPLSLGTF